MKFKELFIEGIFLRLLWILCIYLMGLRHAHILTPQGFKSYYYYMPLVYLFFLLLSILLIKNAVISTKLGNYILTGLLAFNIGNYMYSYNYERFYPDSFTNFFKEVLITNHSVELKTTPENQKTYFAYRKFFQGLTMSNKSCFYVHGEIKGNFSQTIENLNKGGAMKILLPKNLMIKGEKYRITIYSKSEEQKSLEKLSISLSDLNLGDCCLLKADLIKQSLVIEDVAAFTYENPIIEVRNHGVNNILNISLDIQSYTSGNNYF